MAILLTAENELKIEKGTPILNINRNKVEELNSIQ